MNRDETQRLAAMANAMRPDWPTRSLVTFIETRLPERTYREAAVALAWVAADPATATPKRVLEAGPWWNATRAQGATVSVVPTMCGLHPAHKALGCLDCAGDLADVDHAAHVARIRATLRAAKGNR